jgi:hypothetical protein
LPESTFGYAKDKTCLVFHEVQKEGEYFILRAVATISWSSPHCSAPETLRTQTLASHLPPHVTSMSCPNHVLAQLQHD